MEIYDIVYILSSFFMTYVIYKFMKVFFVKKATHPILELLSYMFYFFIVSIVHLFLSLPILLMNINLLLLFIITLNYKSSVKKKILATFLIYITFMCVEMVVVILSGHIKLSIIIVNEYNSIWGIIFIRILSYIVVLLIGNFKNLYRGATIPSSYWFCIVAIPIGTLYVLTVILSISHLPYAIVLISTTLVLLINFATFFLYNNTVDIFNDKLEKRIALEQATYYEEQIILMQESLSNNRIFRHDLKNHLNALYLMAHSNSEETFDHYLEEVINECDGNKIYANTGNIAIDSTLNYKLQYLYKENIKVDTRLKVPSDLALSSFDISKLLGNLVDNAITAVKKIETEKFIKVSITYSKGCLIIKISNSFNGELVKDNNRFKTTAIDKHNHGFGLKSIHQVVEKYNGEISYENTESVFSCSVLLFLDI